MGDLARLFAPETVAVIGASEEPGSVGRAVTENLFADFQGEVFAVNPGPESVLGLECHDDVAAVAPVDVAVVVAPFLDGREIRTLGSLPRDADMAGVSVAELADALGATVERMTDLLREGVDLDRIFDGA